MRCCAKLALISRTGSSMGRAIPQIIGAEGGSVVGVGLAPIVGHGLSPSSSHARWE